MLPRGAGRSQAPGALPSEPSRPNIEDLLSSVVRSTKYKREKAPSLSSSVTVAGRWRRGGGGGAVVDSRAQASNAAQLEHSTFS